MTIELRCRCGKRLRVSPEHAGRQVQCPACGAVFDLPETDLHEDRLGHGPGRPGSGAEEDRPISQPQQGQYQATSADIELAVRALAKGNTPEAVQRQLVKRGVPPEAAAALLRYLVDQAVNGEVIGLLS